MGEIKTSEKGIFKWWGEIKSWQQEGEKRILDCSEANL